MNSIILNKISSCFTKPQKEENRHNKPSMPVLKTLEKDTLSFSGNRQKTASNALNSAASKLNAIGNRVLPDFENMCKRVFGKYFEKARVKEPHSIENKLFRRVLPGEKITTIKSMGVVTDLLASRGITDGSQKTIDSFVKRICAEIKKGDCEITEIRNYRGVLNESKGKFITPYFSKENLTRINTVQTHSKPKIKETAGKESAGYTATHILGKIKGVPFEFQIKGNRVKTVDDGTHLLHSIDIGKSSVTARKIPEEIKEIAEAYKNLSAEKRARYDKYISKCYELARASELTGKKPLTPALPGGIPHELSMPHLIARAKEYGYT